MSSMSRYDSGDWSDSDLLCQAVEEVERQHLLTPNKKTRSVLAVPKPTTPTPSRTIRPLPVDRNQISSIGGSSIGAGYQTASTSIMDRPITYSPNRRTPVKRPSDTDMDMYSPMHSPVTKTTTTTTTVVTTETLSAMPVNRSLTFPSPNSHPPGTPTRSSTTITEIHSPAHTPNKRSSTLPVESPKRKFSKYDSADSGIQMSSTGRSTSTFSRTGSGSRTFRDAGDGFAVEEWGWVPTPSEEKEDYMVRRHGQRKEGDDEEDEEDEEDENEEEEDENENGYGLVNVRDDAELEEQGQYNDANRLSTKDIIKASQTPSLDLYLRSSNKIITGTGTGMGKSYSTEDLSRFKPWIARSSVGKSPITLEIKVDTEPGSCRVYRKFRADRFLWRTLPFNRENKSSIIRVCNETIFHKGMKFTFLCSSESRLKCNEICYFAPYDNITHQTVLNAFGDLETVFRKSGIGKYVARLSLSWSKTIPTIDVPEDHIAAVPDYEAPGGKGKIYTDGCGCIMENAAKDVSKMLGLDYIPTVFQIRLGGTKGILVVQDDCDLRKWFPNQFAKYKSIYLRPSMIKYQAEGCTSLEICGWSKPKRREARLQRAFIRLLTTLGVEVSVFEKLLKDELKRMEGYISTPDNAMWWLEQQGASLDGPEMEMKSIAYRMLKAGHPICEPYIQNTLDLLQKTTRESLHERLNIPVPETASVFGTCDETGTLAENECHVHVTGESFYEGTVLVIRAPASHPGDVQLLRARKPTLTGVQTKRDCIVFSRKGVQPLPDQLSGGDLDGDTYWVSKYKPIFPPKCHPPNPRDRPSDQPQPFVWQLDMNIIEEMKQYVADVMLDYDMPQTSLKWEACEDKAALGAMDPYVMGLSERYEVLLDARKVGSARPPQPDVKLKGRQRSCGPVTTLQTLVPKSRDKPVYGDMGLDPDLKYRFGSAQHNENLRLFETVYKLYRQDFIKIIGQYVDPNRAIGKIDICAPTTKEKAAKQERTTRKYQAVDDLIEKYRKEYMTARTLEELDTVRVRASAFHTAGYSVRTDKKNAYYANYLIVPFAWLGIRYLNELKAASIALRAGHGGPATAIAPRIGANGRKIIDEVMIIDGDEAEERDR